MLAVAAVTGLASSSDRAAEQTCPRQLVLVLADGWDSIHARLCRLQSEHDEWKVAGSCVPAVIGKKGLAWGIGQRPAGRTEQLKQEGDGRSPAGVFGLREIIGYAATAPQGATMPYQQATPTLHCVDDADSPRYNEIVEAAGLANPLPWKSSELLKRNDDLYKWFAVVDYNSAPKVKAAGSCIFVHIWRSADQGTAGCTAMTEKDLLATFIWLNPTANPRLVVLPRADYTLLWKTWGLADPKLLN